jgi:hypothetical protein
VGWVADRYGPRWSLGVGALSGLLAALVGVRYLVRYRNLRLARDGGTLRIVMDSAEPASTTSAAAVRAPEAIEVRKVG